MKFNLEETVRGAELCAGFSLLSVPRDQFVLLLQYLEESSLPPEGLSGDSEQGIAVVPSDGDLPESIRSLQGVSVISDVFRLTLQGHRLSEDGGLGKLWESVLADHHLTPLLSGAFAGGIVSYFPESAKEGVLELLHRTFGIRAV
ncbi:MAG: hypothetical protein IIY12_03660 [Clostridia bacterium]|nr:hypothetical protein [Clostridia bacterium]